MSVQSYDLYKALQRILAVTYTKAYRPWLEQKIYSEAKEIANLYASENFIEETINLKPEEQRTFREVFEAEEPTNPFAQPYFGEWYEEHHDSSFPASPPSLEGHQKVSTGDDEGHVYIDEAIDSDSPKHLL